MTNENQEILERYRAMNDEQLKVECCSLVTITTGNLARLALLVKVREERGHNLSELDNGLLRYLRRIAAGDLLPEIVARFAGRPSVIQKAGMMPIDRQRDIIAGRAEVPAPAPRPRPKSTHVAGSPVVPSMRPVVSTTNGPRVEIDLNLKRIIVSGENVVITRDELEAYLMQLDNMPCNWQCKKCGELAGKIKPTACAKCRNETFENALRFRAKRSQLQPAR